MGRKIPINTHNNGARTGGVTRAASLGIPISGPGSSANNAIGNKGTGHPTRMKTRPITVGTKPNGSRTGTVTRGVISK